MAPGAFSPVHILIVLTVALVVLGPTELPKVIRGAAKAMRELRALRARLDEELRSILDDEAEPGFDAQTPPATDPLPPMIPEQHPVDGADTGDRGAR